MISRFRAFIKLYPLVFLTGFCVGTTYIPFPPWALFFCYIPLWYFAMKKATTLKQVFWGGWWAQFVLTLIGFHWVAFLAHEFGFMPWPLAILTLLIFAALMHLYIPAALTLGIWMSRRLKLKDGATAILLAGLFVLGETHWPSIFQWNLGYPLLWIKSPWAQWADTIGFLGLSWVVYLINATLLWLLLTKDRAVRGVSVAVLISLLGLFYFGGLKKADDWSKTDSEIKVLQIQANIGNQEKYYAEKGAGFQQFIADEFMNLTREGLLKYPETELVVWPESAFPEILDDYAASRKYPKLLRDFSRSIGKPLMTGAFSKDPPGTDPRRDYNGLFLFDTEGNLAAPPYRKSQLLIFGETIPFVETFPILAKYNPGGSGFGRGPGPTVMSFGNPQDPFQIGVQICYESLDPHFSSMEAKLGADFLVNVTNDSWFGPRFEPQQHLYMTLARGLETRRPMVRSTNTGITTVLLANGAVMEESPIGEKWFGLFNVQFRKDAPVTFYSQFGSWLSAVILLVSILAILIGRKRESR